MKNVILAFSLFLICFSSFCQIQTNALKKAKRLTKGENYKSLSNENGYYILPHFGMRYGVFSEFSGNQDLSLFYGLGFGFRKDNLSLESGLSFFHHDSSPVYIELFGRSLDITGSGSPNLVLPFTFRYDIPTGADQTFRIGAFLNSNLAISGLNIESQSRSGQIQTPDGELVDYQLELIKRNPFFFKTGIHSRIRVFKSSFLNLELGRFFTLGANRLYEFTLADDSPIRIARKWEGFSWTIGGSFPLSVWEKKLRKKT
jgi:hypothetical protein